jgi:beta-galactosidase
MLMPPKQTKETTRWNFLLRFLCFLLFISMSASADAAPDWENEAVFQINREPARATFVPFATVEQALREDNTNSPFYRSLNGDWKFNWVPKPELRPTNFFETGFDDSAWKTLPVPASWEMNGYGTPIYVSSGYPFKIDPPRVTGEPHTNTYTTFEERDPVGSYRRTLELPASWDGRHVFIHFDGVESAFYVWVNGQLAGYSENSRSPAEFEITPLLHPGANLLAVQVFKYSDGSYLEDQDMWRMGGIIRDVYLYSTAAARIRDFAVRTTFDAGYSNATLEIKPELEADKDLTLTNWTVQAQLFDADGKPVLLHPAAASQKPAAAKKAAKSSKSAKPGKKKKNKTPLPAFVITNNAQPILNRDWNAKIMNDRVPQRGEPKFAWLSGMVHAPAKWTAETPGLYTLVLTLCDTNGNVVEADRCAVGFRQITITNGQFLVNGQPIKLRGVNRHEINPDTGHAITEADMIKDIVLMKQANLNAVRTCHYPDAPLWYELCDRYGLYVLDEANLEAQGTRGTLANDPRWAGAFLDRAISLAERDKNHPSVIMWSLGNESGFGPNFAAMAGWLHQFDPTRPVHYEGAQGAGPRDLTFEPGENGTLTEEQKSVVIMPDPPCVDVISRFYPRVMQAYAKPKSPENTRWDYLLEIARRTNDSRPVLTSEYAHAMGNAIGNLQEYWDEIYSHPRMLGGFIWEWCDQGLRQTTNGQPVIAYGGDFGDAPNLGIFCIKGIVTSDREIYPKYWEVKHVQQPVAISAEKLKLSKATLKVLNRNSFLNLTNYAVRWIVTDSFGKTVDSGVLPPVHCAPGKSVTVNIPLNMVAAGILPAVEPGFQPGGKKLTRDIELLSVRNPSANRRSLPGGRMPAATQLWLRVSFQTREDSPWAKAGHEVAWQQFTLPTGGLQERLPRQSKTDTVNLLEAGDFVKLSGTNFSATFSRTSGTLTALNFGGRELLAANGLSGPTLQLFRAPTDNDKGFGKWLARDWQRAGLSNLTSHVESFAIAKESPGRFKLFITFTNTATVTITNGLPVATTNTVDSEETDIETNSVDENVIQTVSVTNFVDGIVTNTVTRRISRLKTTWTVRAGGSLEMKNEFIPQGKLPPLPRVGIVMQLAPELENLRWLGRGPLESYPDRKASVDLGVWRSTVTQQYFPYVRPQDCGNHEDVRWAELTDAGGDGLKVSALEKPVSFSALHFTANDLASVKHYYDLQPRPEVILSIDAKVCGLGNGSCGPGVLEKYAVPPTNYTWTVRFEPVR